MYKKRNPGATNRDEQLSHVHVAPYSFHSRTGDIIHLLLIRRKFGLHYF